MEIKFLKVLPMYVKLFGMGKPKGETEQVQECIWFLALIRMEKKQW